MYSEVSTVSPVRQFFHQKWVRIVLILDLLAIIAVIVVAIVNAGKTSVVTFNIAPVDAFIKMGDTYYNNGTYQVSPGSYDVRISHEGLNTKTIRVDLAPNSTTNVTAFLSGTSDGQPSFEFYEQKGNYDSYQLLASIASADNNRTIDHDTSAEEFVAKIEKALAIYRELPMKEYIYSDPGRKTSSAGFAIKNGEDDPECKKITCLLVNYYGGNVEGVVNSTIEKAGYVPADFQIIYEEYK